MNDNTSFSLDRLLVWLDGDSQEAAAKYVLFQRELIKEFQKKGAEKFAEELTDAAFNRVDKQLASPLLNEHFNSSEIADVPNLCRSICKESNKTSPFPGRRIRQLLSPAEQSLITDLAKTGEFKLSQRSLLSQALNTILSCHDFYSEEDFYSLAFQAELEKNDLKEKIKADLKRGLPQLSQYEIELFNRRLLETAYPQIIKRNLADTPETEKLARCKKFARTILLEYQRKPNFFNTPIETDGGSEIGVLTSDDGENTQEKLACQRECKSKLSPRDAEIMELYYTGIKITSSEDEPLSDREIREVIQTLAEKYGLSPNTIRIIVYRCRNSMLKCIGKCLKRKEIN